MSGGTPSGEGEADSSAITASKLPIHFDQYSRYASCADFVRAACPPGSSVLDVGSGALRVLGRLLPDHRVRYVDPLLSTDPREDFAGTLADLPFEAASYDAVVTVDTLEHLPPGQREAFVGRLAQIARNLVIVSAPFSDAGAAAEIDRWIDESHRQRTGRSFSWLIEHSEHGLPSLVATRGILERAGWRCQIAGNGHAPWLRELLPHVIGLLDHPEHRPLLDRISLHFNSRLYRFDHFEPVYRHLVVGRKQPEPIVVERLPDEEATRALARSAWEELQRLLAVEHARHADALVELVHGARADARSRREETAKERALRQRVEQRLGRRIEGERELRDASEARAAELEQSLRRERERGAALTAEIEGMRRSRSWKLTAPLRSVGSALRSTSRGTTRTFRGSFERLTKRIYHALPLEEAARWRAKELFFRFFGPLLRSAESLESFRREKDWRSRSAAGAPPLPEAELPPPREGVPDVFIWGVIDWHFRFQRPQQIATELAREGHRVFYVSNSFARSAEAGFHAERLDPSLALYSVRLQVDPVPVIYQGPPKGPAAEKLARSLRKLLTWAQPQGCWCIIDHPAWLSLASLVPDHRLVYDCMDNHHGFTQTSEAVVRCEREAFEGCETVIASSRWLHDWATGLGARPALVRNGCQPEHFSVRPSEVFRDPDGRRVIGYFGAIAQWFDADLVEAVARRFPGCLVLLVGADSAQVVARLEHLPNVRAIGEVPYARLPHYLHGMDVCLIPFVRNELTLATNPVKVYEYLSAGKPVVTTDLPELAEPDLDRMIRRCGTTEAFLTAVREALDEDEADSIREERQRFARAESWEARTRAFSAAITAAPEALVSVVVVTWNNVELSRRCVESVLHDSGWSNLEVIVVDNASSDATPEWLAELEEREPRARVVRNAENRGFAAGCNQGLSLARGEFLVILNNDTVVGPGWIRTLLAHLRRDPGIGLIGPVTNNIGNEARIATRYTTMEEMRAEVRALAAANAGKSFEIPALAFFCVLMPRAVWTEVGPLDEQFGLGFFEDDDYCQRVLERGRRIVCAEDAFVHHELSASFKQVDEERRRALFETNKAYYESKWGIWIPHRYRPKEAAASRPASGARA